MIKRDGLKKNISLFVCVFFVASFYLMLCFFETNASAVDNPANSYYKVQTCVEASTDNGNSWKPISKVLGKKGIERIWNNEIVTSNTSDGNAMIKTKDDNGNDIDCIVTEKAYWSTDYSGEPYDYYHIIVNESEMDRIDGAKLKFKFTSNIIWEPHGVSWSAVDYRSVWNGKENTRDYNDAIGFCEQAAGCPINVNTMSITMDGPGDPKFFRDDGFLTIGRVSKSISDYNETPVSIYTGGTSNYSFGITINYAVYVDPTINGNMITVYRCNKNGLACGNAGNSRASADAFIIVTYNSEAQNRALTAFAVDENGKYLNSGIAIDTDNVAYGKKASVSNKSFEGYTFKGWRVKKDSGAIINSNNTYTVNSLTTNTYIFAVYERNEFKGYASVASTSTYSNGTGANTGWKNTNGDAFYEIKNCSSSGCKAYFWLKLKTEKGFGKVSYSVKKQINNGVWTNVTELDHASPFAPSNDTEGSLIKKATELLKPGDIVCYQIAFNPHGGNTEIATEKACAFAAGNYDSSIDIKIRNENAPKWSNYRDDYIYAKPGDRIDLKGTYEPTCQVAYNFKPYTTKVVDENINKGSINNENKTTVQSAVNSILESEINNAFKNTFTLYIKGSVAFSTNYSQMVGDATKVEKELKGDSAYVVSNNNVGKSIRSYAQTNYANNSRYTPKTISFGTNNNKIIATVNIAKISDYADIRIPYNFINRTEIITSDNNIVYAGESKKFEFYIFTSPRQNNETNGEYATRVEDSKRKLELCYNGECYLTDEIATGALNSSGKKEGDNIKKSILANIPDVNAGTEVCVRSAVYPAESGADTNWENKEGNGEWSYSEPVCYTVAKKPSIQVWGGNVYSRNKINTATSIKNHLSGVTDYNIFNKNSTNYVFGSWGELGVIAGNTVTGFASGASLGLNLGNLESINNTSFCNRVPLSFANSNCNQGFVPGCELLRGENSSHQLFRWLF